MDKIARIRQEIERLYDGKAPRHDQQCDFSDGYFTGIGVISAFLDTLSEEPDKSLEEAAEEFAEGEWDGVAVDTDGNPLYAQDEIEYAFKAGAEWQKQQMLKDAVEAKTFYLPFGKWRVTALVGKDKIEEDDKVRIVVLKEEE